MSSKQRKIVIIGNGISGVTCARQIRKRDGEADIMLISGESEHFFSRTALMYIYMGHMTYQHTKPYEDWFWDKNRIQLRQTWVEQIDFAGKSLHCQDGSSIAYDVLVLATGSAPSMPEGVDRSLNGVQGLYSLQDLELMSRTTQGIKRALIVGGGLIGIEMAEMLRSRDISVSFLVREANFWGNVLPSDEGKVVNRHIREHGVDLRLSTVLEEILDDGQGKVKGVRTQLGEHIPCDFVGMAIGVSPNISFLVQTPLETSRGILVDEYFRTNLEGVYAIGDCAEFAKATVSGRKSIEQVWYTGRMHGETLGYNLTTSEPVAYRPGVWFNSAKFFDIEYQTYGLVPPEWGEELDSFYWEASSGKACLRMLFEKQTRVLLGVNALGWRLRHVFFDRAINESWHMDRVMSQLDQADFNAEFNRMYSQEALIKFNEEYGKNLRFGTVPFYKKWLGIHV